MRRLPPRLVAHRNDEFLLRYCTKEGGAPQSTRAQRGMWLIPINLIDRHSDPVPIYRDREKESVS